MFYKDLRRENPRNFIDDLTHAVVCAECGKSFEIRFLSEYAYKTRARSDKEGRITAYHYYCSYRCFRKMQTSEPEKPLKGVNVLRRGTGNHGFNAPIPEDELQRMYDMYRSGMDMAEIAERTHRSYDTVRRKLQREGLIPTRKGSPRNV